MGLVLGRLLLVPADGTDTLGVDNSGVTGLVVVVIRVVGDLTFLLTGPRGTGHQCTLLIHLFAMVAHSEKVYG